MRHNKVCRRSTRQQRPGRREFLARAAQGALGLTTLALAGCGSGSQAMAPSTGALRVSIVWPTRTTKHIPTAANSIVLTVYQDGSDVASLTVTVARPTTETTIKGAPTGVATVFAAAYASTDGSGTALATGATAKVTVVAGQTTDLQTITLASTIAKVTVTSATTSIEQGKTSALTAVATNARGQAVLVAPSVSRVCVLRPSAGLAAVEPLAQPVRDAAQRGVLRRFGSRQAAARIVAVGLQLLDVHVGAFGGQKPLQLDDFDQIEQTLVVGRSNSHCEVIVQCSVDRL